MFCLLFVEYFVFNELETYQITSVYIIANLMAVTVYIYIAVNCVVLLLTARNVD